MIHNQEILTTLNNCGIDFFADGTDPSLFVSYSVVFKLAQFISSELLNESHT
jgi:hypothetical protein